MKSNLFMSIVAVLIILGCQSQPVKRIYKADVIVYGGTSSAVTTAVQVARMGKSVIIVSPGKHLGGICKG